jgi:hypothetical protein
MILIRLQEVIMKHRTYFQNPPTLTKSDFHMLSQNAGKKISIDIEQHSIRSKTPSSLGKSLKFYTVHHTCDILVMAVQLRKLNKQVNIHPLLQNTNKVHY